jgi:hypothetical protein
MADDVSDAIAGNCVSNIDDAIIAAAILLTRMFLSPLLSNL